MSRGFSCLNYGTAVFHGTSITLAVRTGVTLPQAVPNLVGVAKGYVAINAGVSGNTSAQGYARFESDVLSHGPAMISLEFGTNDPFNGINAATYADYMANMVIKAQRTGARVTIWVPPFVLDTITNATVATYRTAARSLAASYSCDLFDTYDDTAALADATRTSYYVSGETPDGIHLSATGCAWTAGLVGSGAYVNSFVAATQPVR